MGSLALRFGRLIASSMHNLDAIGFCLTHPHRRMRLLGFPTKFVDLVVRVRAKIVFIYPELEPHEVFAGRQVHAPSVIVGSIVVWILDRCRSDVIFNGLALAWGERKSCPIRRLQNARVPFGFLHRTLVAEPKQSLPYAKTISC